MSEPFLPALSDYLRDESRRTGRADRIAFARTAEDVLAALAEARANRRPVTVQGARTGVTGGAVPEGGLVLNPLQDGPDPRGWPRRNARGAGATLAAIRAAVPPGFFSPPTPPSPPPASAG
jgi:D-lactate dehydrogenase (cytochrome)